LEKPWLLERLSCVRWVRMMKEFGRPCKDARTITHTHTRTHTEEKKTHKNTHRKKKENTHKYTNTQTHTQAAQGRTQFRDTSQTQRMEIQYRDKETVARDGGKETVASENCQTKCAHSP